MILILLSNAYGKQKMEGEFSFFFIKQWYLAISKEISFGVCINPIYIDSLKVANITDICEHMDKLRQYLYII